LSAPIRTLVAVDRMIEPHAVEALLDDPGITVVGVVEQAAGPASRSSSAADVLLVACGEASDSALEFISSASTDGTDQPIVVVCGGNANGFMREALLSGADDIVLLDDAAAPGADTFFAMQKALARRSTGSLAESGHGNLICILGPKGGIGKTLTAANLGVALAESGHRTVIVDLDLQFGDLGLSLGLNPERTIYDLATSGGVLDPEKVDAFLAEHDSGAHVLLAPIRPDQAAEISVEFLRELYPVLVASYDYVVVDTPPGFTPEVIATIDASSSVCVVGMLDAPSLKNTKLGIETLELMGYPKDRVRFVLNRADTSVGISHGDVVAVLGRSPDVLIPSQRDIVRAVNAGEPIVASSPRSEPARAFKALAELHVSAQAHAKVKAPTGRSRRSLLRRGN
jgi:pilus assembly protein CpaE